MMYTKLRHQVPLVIAFVMLASCAHNGSGWTNPLDHKFVADVAPLSPLDSRSLQSYALTLPIFEMTEQADRIRWVSSSEMRIETHNELITVGQGAQSSFAIQRISSSDSPDQRIRLTIGAQGGGPDSVYELIRVPGGWKRTGMRQVEGAWDKIYRRAETNKEAEPAAASDGDKPSN